MGWLHARGSLTEQFRALRCNGIRVDETLPIAHPKKAATDVEPTTLAMEPLFAAASKPCEACITLSVAAAESSPASALHSFEMADTSFPAAASSGARVFGIETPNV